MVKTECIRPVLPARAAMHAGTWDLSKRIWLGKRNTNHNNYGLDPLVVYMRKKQDTMANEMDTNRIMWNANTGKRKSGLTSMNQQDMVEEAMANAIDNTIMRIVNGEETKLASILPLTMSGSRLAKPTHVETKVDTCRDDCCSPWPEICAHRSSQSVFQTKWLHERYGKRRIRLGIECWEWQSGSTKSAWPEVSLAKDPTRGSSGEQQMKFDSTSSTLWPQYSSPSGWSPWMKSLTRSRKLVWMTAGYPGPSSWVPTTVVQTKLHSQRAAEEEYSWVRSPDNALKEIHLGIMQQRTITE